MTLPRRVLLLSGLGALAAIGLVVAAQFRKVPISFVLFSDGTEEIALGPDWRFMLAAYAVVLLTLFATALLLGGHLLRKRGGPSFSRKWIAVGGALGAAYGFQLGAYAGRLVVPLNNPHVPLPNEITAVSWSNSMPLALVALPVRRVAETLPFVVLAPSLNWMMIGSVAGFAVAVTVGRRIAPAI